MWSLFKQQNSGSQDGPSHAICLGTELVALLAHFFSSKIWSTRPSTTSPTLITLWRRASCHIGIDRKMPLQDWGLHSWANRTFDCHIKIELENILQFNTIHMLLDSYRIELLKWTWNEHSELQKLFGKQLSCFQVLWPGCTTIHMSDGPLGSERFHLWLPQANHFFPPGTPWAAPEKMPMFSFDKQVMLWQS